MTQRTLLLLFTGLLAGSEGRASESPSVGLVDARSAFPLAFDAEVIRLCVIGDTLEVDGTYRLLSRPSSSSSISLFYPYPADSLLGDAHTQLLECRAPGSAWQSLDFSETPGRPGVRWRVPLSLGDTLEVHTVYRQALSTRYARYIVTSTKAWGRPLTHARFEIYLPEGAELQRASFPFEKQQASNSAGNSFYLFETEAFMPEQDVVFEWSCPRTGP